MSVTELKKRKPLRQCFDARTNGVTKAKKRMDAGFRKHLLEKKETNAASEHYDEVGYRPLSKPFCILPATADIAAAQIIGALSRCAFITDVLAVEYRQKPLIRISMPLDPDRLSDRPTSLING